jgi:hypothetical protein
MALPIPRAAPVTMQDAIQTTRPMLTSPITDGKLNRIDPDAAQT